MNLVKSALIAQSVAESIGRTFEFSHNINPEKVEEMFNGQSDLYITDDTQMTLFGIEAVTEINDLITTNDIENIKIHIEHLVEWRNTQNGSYDPKVNTSWLGQKRAMWKQVAPGGTCLTSLSAIRRGSLYKNTSDGCGTVMKALPFALSLLDGGDPTEHMKIACTVSSMTHGSDKTYGLMTDYMTVAMDLMSQGRSTLLENIGSVGTEINQWGGGWNGPDCLRMALWAVSNSSTYEELVINSIAHDGDSDSVACVAGALWALAGLPICNVGIWNFDNRLIEADLIVEVADRFDLSLV